MAHGLGPNESVNAAKAAGKLAKVRQRGGCHRCGSEVPVGSGRWKFCSDECFTQARAAKGHGFPRAQASSAARGYGAEHRALRAQLLPLAYGNNCHHCGDVMQEGQSLHLDHNEDRTDYRGIVHGACNRRDGAKRGRQRQIERSLREGWRPGQAPSARRRSQARAS